MKPTSPKSSLKSTVEKLFPQWLTGIGVTVIMLQLGIMSGWSSPYLAQLTKPGSVLFLTSEQAAWVASLLNLGRFFGAICGAISVNYLGSKRSVTLSILPISCCWVFTMIARSYLWLYVARACGGVGIGMIYSCFALYVGEIALPEIRGGLVSLAIAGGGSVGVLLSSICGSYLRMDVSAAIYFVPCIAVGMLFLWLPESPHWLVKIEDYKRAKRSIAWYLPDNNHDEELANVRTLVSSTNSDSFCDKVQKLKLAPIRKAIIHIIVLFTCMQITGLNSIVYYMETIFVKSKLTLIDPSTAVIYVHMSGIVASALSVYLIDKCGRKFLLILSCTGVAVAMAGLGGNSYLISIDADISKLQWLSFASVLVFMTSYFVGLMSIPSTVLSEIFPSDIKSLAGCIASLVGGLWGFGVTKTFQPLVDSIGEAYVFWMHGLLAIILIPYVFFLLPETKGKSLKEIQDKLIRIQKIIQPYCGHADDVGSRDGINKAWLGRKPYVFLSKASTVEVILGSSRHIDKSCDYEFLQPWLGTRLLTSSDSKWYSRRKILTPTFHFNIFEDFVQVFGEQNDVLVRKMSAELGKPSFNVFPYITLYTLDIICETAMGRRISAQNHSDSDYVRAVCDIGSIIQKRQASLFYHLNIFFRLSPLYKKHQQCIRILHDFSNKVITERRKEIVENHGEINGNEETKKRLAFLDLLIKASGNGCILSDDDIREEVNTFMFEGHDTASSAVCWTLYLLGYHSEVQEKVVDELEMIFSEGDYDRPPTLQDLKNMKYLVKCIKEALRLYPSVPILGRKISEDIKIGKYTVPKGTTALVIVPVLHRDPEVFQNPEKFDPERFSTENMIGRHPYAYDPFSAGLRNCIGKKFALLEEKAIISGILKKYTVEATKREDIRISAELVMRAKDGLHIKIQPRAH